MAVISHGSDLNLAPTIRPLSQGIGATPRRAIQSAAGLGFRAVQLDATMPGTRPRELDASARRDLLTTLHRASLSPAGVDFLIPAEHYRDAEHVDRAVSALHGALGLAGDLGRVPLTVNLPMQQAEPQILEELLAAADMFGVRVAVLHGAEAKPLSEWLRGKEPTVVGAALDPAAMLAAGLDPVEAAQTLGDRLAVARLADTLKGQSDGSRCMVGGGDLDLQAYRVMVDLAPGRVGPVVLDLSKLGDPVQAAKTALNAWQAAAMRM